MPRRWRGVLLALLVVAGCSGKKQITPAPELWREANDAFDEEAWEYAVDRYRALLDQYPFDPEAEKAELRIAQAHYNAKRHAEAIAALTDFERMHPTSPHLPYVEYHLGMSYLAQTSTSDRDRSAHTSGLAYFRNVIDRFPQSPWAERARLRMRECREALAAHDAEIAGYYLRHRNLRAAEARLRGLLETYPDTDATAEMLYVFAQAWAKRAEHEGATLALATLARHHPAGQLGVDARRRLETDDGTVLPETDPLPLLITHIDRLSGRADRRTAPKPVSAYPEVGGIGQGRY